MQDALDRATNSTRELARRMGVDHHDVLLVLGTGLSDVAEILRAAGTRFRSTPFRSSPRSGERATAPWAGPCRSALAGCS